jgi:cytochrome c oxidase assembly protein subunit 15
MLGIASLFLPIRVQPFSSVLAADVKIAPKAVAVWLLACCGLILSMVVVGGMTRLTLSGLSITEWKPLIGIIPPLTHAQWLAEFARYQQIPEYRTLHYGMSLADFKTIFFWEYAHRLLGRLIGVAFAVPLGWFWLRGQLPRRLAPALLGILALGLAQGALGWYMVESGLADRIEVSQYRLVAHLVLALAIYSLILWTALGLIHSPVCAAGELKSSSPPCPGHSVNPSPSMGKGWEGVNAAAMRKRRQESRLSLSTASRADGSSKSITPIPGSSPGQALARPHPGGGKALKASFWRRASEAVIALVGLTIAAGGFVAGTRAGFTYNTFPLMDGRLVPAGYDRLHPYFRNWFENIPAVQFDHRLLAITTFAAVLLLTAAGLRRPLPRPALTALLVLLAAAVVQLTFGISTLLLVVPIPLAALHQAGAVLLLTAAVVFRHTLRSVESIEMP